MLIKQFSFWCLVLDEVLSSIDIEEKFAFKPIAENTTQSTSGGFVPFLQNDGTYRYILENKDCICLAYKIEKKVITTQIIENEYRKYLDKCEEERALQVLDKDSFIEHLYKKALAKSDIYKIVFLPSINIVLIDAVGSVADEIKSQLLRCFNLKKLRTASFNHGRQYVFKNLIEKGYSGKFALNEECEIKGEEKRKIKISSANLFGEHISSFINYSDEIKQIGLIWDNTIEFVINDNMEIKKLNELCSLADDSEITPTSLFLSEIRALKNFLIEVFRLFGGLQGDLFDNE
ncbi:MAG: recombination-associated protein RdgC [Neisseriaceae bacterium]|nr:recombination-associated protein RdgC [Neisseriaceae bacterium]